MKFRENKVLAKISEFTVINQRHSYHPIWARAMRFWLLWCILANAFYMFNTPSLNTSSKNWMDAIMSPSHSYEDHENRITTAKFDEHSWDVVNLGEIGNFHVHATLLLRHCQVLTVPNTFSPAYRTRTRSNKVLPRPRCVKEALAASINFSRTYINSMNSDWCYSTNSITLMKTRYMYIYKSPE